MRLQNALHRTQADARRLGSIRPVQWGVSPGGGARARSTICLIALGGSGALPGLGDLSRNGPATPSAMKRACHAQTTGFDLPDRRMISVVPQPSAVARMMLARQTCFWGALRSATIASSRRRIVTRDLDDNPCSHAESLNCFGRLGNRPNASDH
jgi:hypothetical protein